MADRGAVSNDREPTGDARFERVWRDSAGGEWAARVDRVTMRCGACDTTRYLHLYTPKGERLTFTLAPDATLEGVPAAALEAMATRPSTPPDRP